MQLEKGDNTSMEYSKKFIEGLGSQFMYRAAAALLTLIKLAILARLLTPTQFGVFSLILIALGITEAATETGINLTILQSKKPLSFFLNTAWVISIIRGIIIGAIMLVFGKGLSIYFQDPTLFPLIALAAGVPIIRGFINPSIVSLQRELKFLNDGFFRISLTAVECVSAVLIALMTKSVIALIIALLISAVWEVVLSFIVFKAKPKFEFKKSRATLILKNTKWLSLTAVLNYLQENIDNLLIGRYLGTTQLGYYDLGYRLSHKSHEFARATHYSSFPIYIKLKEDRARLIRAFKKTFTSSMGVLFLAALPLIFYPQLTVIVLGNQWAPIVPSVPILSLSALLLSATTLCYTLFLSTEEYSRVTFHLFISTTCMVIGIALLAPLWGLQGGALAVLLARLLSFPLIIWGVWKHLKHAKRN